MGRRRRLRKIDFNGTDMSGPTLTFDNGLRQLTLDQTNVICFTRDTQIRTQTGARAIQDLQIGDLVITADHGAKPILWIGHNVLGKDDLAKNPNLRPIRIAAGALGHGLPERDLLVSPQHRMLVQSRIAKRLFGDFEVLVAAKQLLALDGVSIAHDVDYVEYWHFLFDQHEVVFANGAPSESLYTGAQALATIRPEALEEILAIFPELKTLTPSEQPQTARTFLKGRDARDLAKRHESNDLSLLDAPRMIRTK